ncbi:hypothetical protein GCM10010273_16240 [Streptomyces lavendulocolor]
MPDQNIRRAAVAYRRERVSTMVTLPVAMWHLDADATGRTARTAPVRPFTEPHRAPGR